MKTILLLYALLVSGAAPAQTHAINTKGNWLVEPGKFQLWLAKDSASGEPAEFQVMK